MKTDFLVINNSLVYLAKIVVIFTNIYVVKLAY